MVRAIYDTIIPIKFRWGGHGFLKRSRISSHITVRVKTLHGKRLTHSIKVSILDKVEKIGEKLIEADPDELSAYH